MPFVQRVVEPKYLSRTYLHDESGKPIVTDCELDAIANCTLSNALRQLASLVLVADDIFVDLAAQLELVTERSKALKAKIERVENRVAHFDPKKVTVPESDLNTFASLRVHYVSRVETDGARDLFIESTRPQAVRALYAAAATTGGSRATHRLTRHARNATRPESPRFMLCTPVLGARSRKIRARVDIDIETRLPAAVEDLRRWTSDEALGDITVRPDCVSRITTNTTVTVSNGDIVDATGAVSGDEGIDHKLPSPEEQVQAVALKFPAEIVAVDITGRQFHRMCSQRRSLLHVDHSRNTGTEAGTSEVSVRRRSRTRKPRTKRRNTIAGTDQKEIEEAICGAGEQTSTGGEPSSPESRGGVVFRSKSSDLLRPTKRESPSENKKSHFNTLKQWGMNRLKMINRSFESKSSADSGANKVEDIDDVNIYETVTMRRRRSAEREKRASSAEDRKTSTRAETSLPISTPLSGAMSLAVKLRESAVQRRRRRSEANKDEPHSSSGNWSASSESGRTSIGSEITSSTAQPRSTTSCATSSNSLNVHQHGTVAPSSVVSRRRVIGISTSASGSVTSEGTLTPDIATHDFHYDDDGESSVYSCDTEGYYTSFHVDSGLKTLKEEAEINTTPSAAIRSTNALSDTSVSATSAENEYELFGKGSTSTTTSSAGTVCTTLMAAGSHRSLVIGPAVPERKSSLLSRKMDPRRSGSSNVSRNSAPTTSSHKSDGDVSPDSGHNTSSSPIESINSPSGQRSCSEFEFSESSDLEGVDRIERIRVKTTIDSSRIPSMCVITPQHSDDECTVPSRYGGETTKPSRKTAKTEKHNDIRVHPARKLLETDLDNPISQENVANNEQIATSVTAECTTKVDLEKTNGSVAADAVIVDNERKDSTTRTSPSLRATLQPLNNMFGKLRTNISNLTHRKECLKPAPKTQDDSNEAVIDAGDYVTIADVRNNNRKPTNYANDIVAKRNLANVLSGKQTTEYVSLDELPKTALNTRQDDTDTRRNDGEENGNIDSLERRRRQGARVTLDAEGKVIYSSDSLKRKKGAYTTFEPGPYVKDVSTPSPLPIRALSEQRSIVRAVRSLDREEGYTTTPQPGRLVIRAIQTPSGAAPPTTDFVRDPPCTIVVSPSTRPTSPEATATSAPVRGAYVNVLKNHRRTPMTADEEGSVHLNSNAMHSELMHAIDGNFYGKTHRAVVGRIDEHSSNQYSDYDRSGLVYRTLPSRKPPPMLRDDSNRRPITPDIANGALSPRRSSFFNYNAETNRDADRHYIEQTRYQQSSFLGDRMVLPYVDRCEEPSPIARHNFTRGYDYSKSTMQNSPRFLSSTPTKPNDNIRHISRPPIEISDLFSPIKTKPETARYFETASQNDASKIPPIDPRNTGEYQSSTPTTDRPIGSLNAAVDLAKSVLSPKKSTMSHDELYAVIHRRKKKLNAGSREDGTLSPSPTATSETVPTTRTENYENDLRSQRIRKSGQHTSTLDFKRLLLQHGTKSRPVTETSSKMSAVERLKSSKPSKRSTDDSKAPMNILELSGSPRNLCERKFVGDPTSPRHDKQRVAPKLVSPRSAWRFASPRSDVLSSTILEDCREDDSSGGSFEKDDGDIRELQRSIGPASSTNLGLSSNCAVLSGGMSRAEYLRVQKAKFMSNYDNSEVSVSKTPSPGSLETAL